MAIEVVFTQKDYVEGLKALPVTLKGSFYSNSFPQNCLYYQGNGIYSGDCWNSVVKAYIWGKGVLPKNVGSYWFNPGRYGMGDWNGRQILDHCYDISLNFEKIIPGEYLLTEAEDHAAVYVGETKATFDGVERVYNVVECTPIWANGIQYSYLDSKGRRFQCKGGAQAGSWKYHAKLPWIEYPSELSYTVKSENGKQILEVDGKGKFEISTTTIVKKL